MKIAIHRDKGFSLRWVAYCEKNGIPYKIVDAYTSDIVEQVSDCGAFMWHHHHGNYKDVLFAKQLLYSLQAKGLKVFPDFNTTWHFDDKVGQKYLLEAIGAPLVPSYVFYTKEDAYNWIGQATFPKVFKLRGGAGASNVKLVKTNAAAKRVVRKAFGRRGFPACDHWGLAVDSLKKYLRGRATLRDIAKYLALHFLPHRFGEDFPRERGYAYFQDFIPNNLSDIRIVIVADKAFALKRMCRENDFRASGSGNIIYDRNQIDERCVKIAFDVNEKLRGQSIAFDFVFDANNTPLIVEISYAYSAPAYDRCEGYWDKNMNWYGGRGFDFCGWMVEKLISDND